MVLFHELRIQITSFLTSSFLLVSMSSVTWEFIVNLLMVFISCAKITHVTFFQLSSVKWNRCWKLWTRMSLTIFSPRSLVAASRPADAWNTLFSEFNAISCCACTTVEDNFRIIEKWFSSLVKILLITYRQCYPNLACKSIRNLYFRMNSGWHCWVRVFAYRVRKIYGHLWIRSWTLDPDIRILCEVRSGLYIQMIYYEVGGSIFKNCDSRLWSNQPWPNFGTMGHPTTSWCMSEAFN